MPSKHKVDRQREEREAWEEFEEEQNALLDELEAIEADLWGDNDEAARLEWGEDG